MIVLFIVSILYDVIQDSTLLVTCSADKNIRIWGLDFGDCHKSLFAHDDSVMGIKVRQWCQFVLSCINVINTIVCSRDSYCVHMW